jgi:peptide/nickel transport system substrate-binding protein
MTRPPGVLRSASFGAALAGTVLPVMLLSGCLPGRDAGDPASNPNAASRTRTDSVPTITLAVPGDKNAFLKGLARLVFLPLLERDENGETVGRLAGAWEFSRDGRDVRLTLRKDIRWQDGAPVTAHDVKFSIELQHHPAVLKEDLGETAILDDSTLFIRDFEGYNEDYYPSHLLENLDPTDFWDWEFWQRPVGSGPYRVVRYVPEIGFVLEANPDYAFGTPKIKRVVVRLMGRQAAYMGLLAGEVDLFPADVTTQIAEVPGHRVYYDFSSALPITLFWQTRLPMFQSASVRRALAMALDREALMVIAGYPADLVPVVDGPLGGVRRRSVPSEDGGDYLPPIPFDPAEARRLLAEEGWVDRDGDQVLDRDGHPFSFTTLVPAGGMYQRLGTMVQEQFRRAGVLMEVQTLAGPVIQGRIRAGEFEAAILRNGYGSMGRWDHGYVNPELDRLQESYGYLRERGPRAELAREITRILQRDVPNFNLVPHPVKWIVNDRIRGLESPWRADPIRYLEELWLEDGP